MNFLFQALRDTVETERTGPLDENHLVVQIAEHIAMKKIICGGKEILLAHGEYGTLGSNIGTNTNQFTDVTLLTKAADLTVEFHRGHATLEDVAENQCKTTWVVDATTHKV